MWLITNPFVETGAGLVLSVVFLALLVRKRRSGDLKVSLSDTPLADPTPTPAQVAVPTGADESRRVVSGPWGRAVVDDGPELMRAPIAARRDEPAAELHQGPGAEREPGLPTSPPPAVPPPIATSPPPAAPAVAPPPTPADREGQIDAAAAAATADAPSAAEADVVARGPEETPDPSPAEPRPQQAAAAEDSDEALSRWLATTLEGVHASPILSVRYINRLAEAIRGPEPMPVKQIEATIKALARLAPPAIFHRNGAREDFQDLLTRTTPGVRLIWPDAGSPFDPERHDGKGDGAVASIVSPGLERPDEGRVLLKASVTRLSPDPPRTASV